MNLIHHRRWRRTLIEHYGSVAAFPLPGTVRNMLAFLREKLVEEYDMRTLLKHHPTELANWLSHSQPDLDEAQGYIAELEGWLKERAR